MNSDAFILNSLQTWWKKRLSNVYTQKSVGGDCWATEFSLNFSDVHFSISHSEKITRNNTRQESMCWKAELRMKEDDANDDSGCDLRSFKNSHRRCFTFNFNIVPKIANPIELQFSKAPQQTDYLFTESSLWEMLINNKQVSSQCTHSRQSRFGKWSFPKIHADK